MDILNAEPRLRRTPRWHRGCILDIAGAASVICGVRRGVSTTDRPERQSRNQSWKGMTTDYTDRTD